MPYRMKPLEARAVVKCNILSGYALILMFVMNISSDENEQRINATCD